MFHSFPVQGLAFLRVVNQIWDHRSVSDDDLNTDFDVECKKWVLLLLRLIDITGSQAIRHLHVFIKGEVTKPYRTTIKNTVSATCDSLNF